MALDEARELMVREQLEARGITDPRVLQAFRRVPRHVFVPEDMRDHAHEDRPIAIPGGQTISQPYMAALMTELLRLQGHERVLEIGTGSGYQAAILAELALEVYSVERIPELAEAALRRWKELGYLNIHLALTPRGLGWPDQAPFDGIIVTAAVPRVPQPLVEQLAEGGRLVLPVGSREQQTLVQIEQVEGKPRSREIGSCVFVPLIGEYGWPPETGTSAHE